MRGSNPVALTADRSPLSTQTDKLKCLTTKTQTTRTILYQPAYCSKTDFSHYFFLFFADSFCFFSIFIFPKFQKKFAYSNFVHKL